MNSHDKITAVVAQARAIQPDGIDPTAQAALLLLDAFAPQVTALLPADPAELDELLLTGAAWALGLRSDDAPVFVLAADGREQPVIAAGAQPAVAELMPDAPAV